MPGEWIGFAIDGFGDVTGDGIADLILGSHWIAAGTHTSGVGRVYSGGCLRALERSCVAAPNSVGPGAFLATHGTQSIADDDLVLVADGLPPGAMALAIFGSTPAQLSFGHGFLCVRPFGPGPSPLYPALPADAAGHFERAVGLAAAGPPITGTSWTFQVLYRDPLAGGVAFNGADALTATFCP